MTFLDELHADRAVATPDDARNRVVRDWLTSRPHAMFDDLRQHAPTMQLGGMAFVSRYHDAVDVLGRNDVFSVAPYGQAMMRINRGPNFLLGMDDGPEYRQQLRVLGRAFARGDVERVQAIVAARTAEVLDAALTEGRLDLVDGFGRKVPALFIADYFGVTDPDPGTLAQWARAIFTDAFVNVLGEPLLSRRAMRASKAFRAHLDGLIATARTERAAGVTRDDVLGRLLAQQEAGERALPDGRIRDDLLWCVAGMIDNVSAGVCRAIDLLLSRPAQWHEAAGAARAGDDARVQAYVCEALRFCTPTPVAVRRCVRPHIVSRGTPHGKTIGAGTLVFVGLGAAMMDHTVVDGPTEFRIDRPPQHYLHFGAGLHTCLGKHIAMTHLTAMVSALLRLPDLRRARGAAGRLRCLGPFPDRFVVQVRT